MPTTDEAVNGCFSRAPGWQALVVAKAKAKNSIALISPVSLNRTQAAKPDARHKTLERPEIHSLLIMKKSICIFFAACAVGLAASVHAAVITWDFNPGGLHGNAGSSSLTFTQSGWDLTVRGYDNVAGPDPARELFYKNEPPHGGAMERGLGAVGTPSNEFTLDNSGNPANYLQLDLRNLLAAQFSMGQLQVTSLQAGESFQIYGSNAMGSLGTALGTPFAGLTFDNQWVNIPDFGQFQFIAIAAASGRVLPVAFRATPIPEMGVLFPIAGLLVAVSSTHYLRRRRRAQMNS